VRVPVADLELSSFPPLCHVTFHWRNAPPGLQREFEEGLRKHVGLACCHDNPAGSWFLGIAGLLFGVVLLLVALIFLVIFLPPRRPW